MTITETQIDTLAEILWDYHLMHHKLEQADSIFVLGNHDIRIADYAISLVKAGWSQMVIFSGGVIHRNAKLNVQWEAPEAEVFAQYAIRNGIQANQIVVESKSKNTGENFQFTARVLAERGFEFNKFIVVQKPYMERRTYATGKVHWPDKTLIITSPPTSFQDYAKGEVPKNQIISFMVGDLQRIKVYGEKGFQIPQEIPEKVWDAYQKLIALGFTDRLIKD